jgi:hypothetical protein
MEKEGEAEAGITGTKPIRLTVHAPRFCSNVHVLDLLDGVVWLAQQEQRKTCPATLIEVLLHPVGSPWVRALRIVSNWTVKAWRQLFRRYNLDDEPSGTSITAANHRKGTITGQLRGRYESVRIPVDENLTVAMHRIKVGYLKSLAMTLRAVLRGFKHYVSCMRRGRFDRQVFLVSRYRGVHIGDLIASEAIGFNPNAGGHLQRCGSLAMLRGIVDAIYTVDYILGQSWNAWDYTTVSETTYLEELYRRTLHQQGLQSLEMYDYSGQLYILPGQGPLPNPFIARAWQGPTLSPAQRERAKRYMSERLNATRHLWYMNVGRNVQQSQDVRDEQGQLLAPDTTNVTAVVFLHSFDDAQFQFGLDGFDDLYEWTVTTINECLANRHVGRVLIKEHPNVDPVAFPGDKHALRRLRARYGGVPRVVFVDRYTNVKAFAGLGCVCGLTNYGSVAEECVPAGIPMIASAKGPWGTHYPFLRVWESPAEYVALLRRLTAAEWRPPGEREMEALAEFVFEYRVNIRPAADVPLWFQWAALQDPSINILDRDVIEKVERRIVDLEPDAPSLIGWLRERAMIHRTDRPGHRSGSSSCQVAC